MIIYKVLNKINQKVYIGQTTSTLDKRKASHISNSINNPKCKFHYALRKHGINNFIWCVICECNSRAELNEKEKQYIKEYDSYKNGYNSTHGGEGTYVRTPEILNHLRKPKSELHKLHLRKPKSEIGRYNMRLARKPKTSVMNHKNRMNQPKRRIIHQFDLDNNFIKQWESIQLAVKEFGVGVSHCLAGYQKQSKGFIWKYADNNPPDARQGGKRKKE